MTTKKSPYKYEVDYDYDNDYQHGIYRLVRLADGAILAAYGNHERMAREVTERGINNITVWR